MTDSSNRSPACGPGPAGPARERRDRTDAFFSVTQALCPTCRALVQGKIVFRQGQVVLQKRCPRHGVSEGLLSSDVGYWTRSLGYTKPGSRPHEWSSPVEKGCPHDCGLCPDHEQHTCAPIIEITDHCDLSCPICLVWNRHGSHMPLAAFREVIDGLRRKEGTLELALLSGGEPTLHPQFFELCEYALRSGAIRRLLVSSHGLRLARDEEFARRFQELGLYLSLQFDSLRDDRIRTLRGASLLGQKRKLLEVCGRLGIPTVLVPTIARGVNEDELGALVEFAFDHDFVTSITFQPAAFTGRGGSSFPAHPLSRLTQVDMHRLLAEQTGWLAEQDFLPVPCSHPSCYSTCYVIRDASRRMTPLTRFGEISAYLDSLTNRAVLSSDARAQHLIQDAIYRLWSAQSITADGDAVLAALRALMTGFDAARSEPERRSVAEGTMKAIFIHAFMDEHDWELSRVRKCCTHYALADGRLMPGCAYNAIHRPRDAREEGR